MVQVIGERRYQVLDLSYCAEEDDHIAQCKFANDSYSLTVVSSPGEKEEYTLDGCP
jgi:hypothetical protein